MIRGGYLKPNSKRALVMAVGAFFVGLLPFTALANDASDTAAQLRQANVQAAEADDHVNNLDAQIAQVQGQINQTQADIAATDAAIADAQARMATDQAKLDELIQTQYKQDHQTKLEQLVASKTFSDFVDKQEYLQAGQDKVAAAVDAVLKVKKELEAKSADQKKLQGQLAAQQNGLNFARAQAQNQLDQINAAKQALKAKLAKYQGGKVVEVGDHVTAGDLIGFQGNTGYSTGTHLHYEVRLNGNPVNPRNYTPGRFQWPLDPGFGVNQEFGKPNWAAAYSFHTGIDLEQYYGAPVYAAASGTVSFSGYDDSGFGEHVIIDHGDGLQTLYGHMAQ